VDSRGSDSRQRTGCNEEVADWALGASGVSFAADSSGCGRRWRGSGLRVGSLRLALLQRGTDGEGKIQDKDGGETEYTADVTVLNEPPEVTADPDSQAVQYSDAITDVTFTAADVAADSLTASTSWSADGGGSFTAGLPEGLMLQDPDCSISGGTNLQLRPSTPLGTSSWQACHRADNPPLTF
jgi:hypothetical protein